MKQKIYEYLTRIPKGKVVTYKQIAQYLGNPRLCRYVGTVLHNNPDPIRYPCYKVVNSQGKLAEQFGDGGLEVQCQRLLADGIAVQGDRVDLKKYQMQECALMEYRKLPHGTEQISALGLGMGAIQTTPAEEIEAIVRKAIDHGVNFFDMCAGCAGVYAPFGRAIKNQREKVYLQVHFGAVYNDQGEYAWGRDMEQIKRTFYWELEQLGTDYVDFGFLHCIDEDSDWERMLSMGVLDLLQELKAQGVVRHIGFSSHTPAVANKILDTGLMDMMLFSINPAYDFERGDEYGVGSVQERFELFRRCEKEGVGISVMKPFLGGKLLDKEQSPFGVALNHYQCLQYVLDRPGVLSAVPGVQSLEQLDVLLGFVHASEEEKDYALIGDFTAELITGTCVYCNHYQPCPAGIDIGLVNKYYDLARVGDVLAANHYKKLTVKADACLNCGHCESRCPFGVKQESRMKEIENYFKG